MNLKNLSGQRKGSIEKQNEYEYKRNLKISQGQREGFIEKQNDYE